MRETFGTRRMQDSNQEEVPEWLKVMYNTVYFEACTTHRHEKKDQFCIDCSISLCSNCLPIHNHLFNPPHKIVKIRRYVYCEVIKRQDLSKHFNCSGIQAYQTNKSKVIFLKQRTQQQQPQQHNNNINISSNNNNSCIICQRSLPEPLSLYCSIACKVFAKEETIQVKDEGLNNSNEGSTVSSLKRQRSRKGVPLRAPMF